jgi:hypothetical protein
MLEQLLELWDDGLVLGKDKGYTGEIGKENGGVVDGDIFLLTDHVFDNLSDNVQRKEDIVELINFVVALEVGSSFLDYFAHVGWQITHYLYHDTNT